MVSTHNKEMSEEVHSAKYLNSSVASMAVCAALNRAGMSYFWPRLQQRSPDVTYAILAMSVKLNH